MQLGIKPTAEEVALYTMFASLLLVRREITRLEERVGMPHPERETIDQALNLMAPSYREQLEHDVYETSLCDGWVVSADGVEQAARQARALRETFGFAAQPRRSTII
jgi:hypothetical protein